MNKKAVYDIVSHRGKYTNKGSRFCREKKEREDCMNIGETYGFCRWGEDDDGIERCMKDDMRINAYKQELEMLEGLPVQLDEMQRMADDLSHQNQFKPSKIP